MSVKKFATSAGSLAAIALAASVMIAGPAAASETRTFGARSCSGGSVASEARSNSSQIHRHTSGGLTRTRQFDNTSGAFQTYTYFAGYPSVSGVGISTGGSGYFSSARTYCDF